MSDRISKLGPKSDNPDELRAFIKALSKTINKLTDKVRLLEDENNKLKNNKGEKGDPIDLTIPYPQDVTDEEAICIMEINKLKTLSLQGPLTLEECRKVETYVRTLNLIRGGAKAQLNKAHTLSPEELTKQLDKALASQE